MSVEISEKIFLNSNYMLVRGSIIRDSYVITFPRKCPLGKMTACEVLFFLTESLDSFIHEILFMICKYLM